MLCDDVLHLMFSKLYVHLSSKWSNKLQGFERLNSQHAILVYDGKIMSTLFKFVKCNPYSPFKIPVESHVHARLCLFAGQLSTFLNFPNFRGSH